MNWLQGLLGEVFFCGVLVGTVAGLCLSLLFVCGTDRWTEL